jgi:hypothetical protein
MVLFGQTHRFFAGARFAHDLDFRIVFQDAAEAETNECMIIYQ